MIISRQGESLKHNDVAIGNRIIKTCAFNSLYSTFRHLNKPISYRCERAVRYLLKKGANMFYQGRRDQNPLVDAAVKGNTGVVRIMLEHLDVTGVPLAIS